MFGYSGQNKLYPSIWSVIISFVAEDQRKHIKRVNSGFYQLNRKLCLPDDIYNLAKTNKIESINLSPIY